ncbi:hypothetical protein SEA_WATERT_8 [Microbacterium phage WaterT]|nr:hypothetical protein SEA_WATERT_8 [Microbacterium phage WaterT]
MDPAIREELDQTPAWWDRQYRTLVQNQIPRSAAYHEGHEMEEERTYADLRVYRWCMECGVSIDDYEESQ